MLLNACALSNDDAVISTTALELNFIMYFMETSVVFVQFNVEKRRRSSEKIFCWLASVTLVSSSSSLMMMVSE